MSLLSLKSITLNIADKCIFNQIDMAVAKGDKIALVGRNGQGKSTLLSLLARDMTADSGEMVQSALCRVKMLNQQVPQTKDGNVFTLVAQGLGKTGQLLVNYQASLEQGDDDLSQQLSVELDEHDGWHHYSQINSVISRLGLEPNSQLSDLSGGMKRRVMLAQALVTEPDVLLLDEPTNHLDIESIEWLESFLQQYAKALIVVSHDRTFLNKIAKTVVEIDRTKLYRYEGNFANFVKRREQRLLEEQRHQQQFDKKLEQEEQWIRQGIKARRTRNEGRVRALQQLRQIKQQQIHELAKIETLKVKTQVSAKDLIQANMISYQYSDKVIFSDLSLSIRRGDKLGIIGPNGCGKTTLLKVLLGQLEPSSGNIKRFDKLKIAYFDQLRNQLDDEMTMMDNVAQGRSEVMFNGKSLHVASYLSRFLFTSDQFNKPIKRLSGGERNRLLLAKLFSTSFNCLVMDEPTNDLDIESMEVLESMLVELEGTLLVVSHDRQFIDNVVTSTLIYTKQQGFNEYVGGYSDYLDFIAKKQVKPIVIEEKTKAKSSNKTQKKQQSAKLSYNQQRELQQLPQQIEQLEVEIDKLHQTMATSEFYQQEASVIATTKDLLQQKEQALENCYLRWEELEAS